jgi:hypothetical protein
MTPKKRRLQIDDLVVVVDHRPQHIDSLHFTSAA